MNNNELAEKIADGHGLTKSDARKLVNAIVAEVGEAAARGEEVSLSGFGKFKVKATPERAGRNPATGQPIKIAASKKFTFQPAKAVRDKLNG